MIPLNNLIKKITQPRRFKDTKFQRAFVDAKPDHKAMIRKKMRQEMQNSGKVSY